MNQNAQVGHRSAPRLNPFIFPSDTDFRFALLLIVVISATVFIYDWIHAGYAPDFAGQALTCFQEFGLGSGAVPEALGQSAADFNSCLALIYRQNLAWIFGGLAVVFALAAVLFFALPYWKIKREKLIPLSEEDAPEVRRYLEGLCAEVGLAPPPEFYWDPLSQAASGVAFGHPGRRFVALRGGLVVGFYTDLPAFRAVMLHELAHLHNKDVNKTYFTIALWRAFLAAALLPLAINLLTAPRSLLSSLGVIAQLGWRTLALVALVYLVRNAVLRTREYYADLRADAWAGPGSALQRVLSGLPAGNAKRPLFLRLHPTPGQRREVLENVLPMFVMGYAVPLATGIAAGITFRNLERLFTMLLTASQAPHMAGFGAALLTTPWILGIVGIGIWRQVFASGQDRLGLRGLLPFAGGLWLGALAGNTISFESYTLGRLAEAGLGNLVGRFVFYLVWASLLLLLISLFLRWVQTSARLWLEVSADRRFLRRAYIIVLSIACLVMAAWLGPLLSITKFTNNLDMILVAVLTDLGALFTLVTYNPVTILFWASLWVVPLASWFWRRRRAVVQPWAYLPPLEGAQRTEGQLPADLKPLQAALAGAFGGFLYAGFYLIARLATFLTLSETLRASDSYKLASYAVAVGIAVLFQVVLAVVVAAWAPRLGALHGLCAAFFASLVISAAILIVNRIFGGVLDLEFTLLVFNPITNIGALLALSTALVSTPIIHAFRKSPA